MTEDGRQNKVLLIICVGLALATLIAYEPIRHNGFVTLDDHAYIIENSNVTGGLTWSSLKWAFTTTHTGYPHPITWLSHILDCEIYGLNPAGHHITSVLLHIINTLVLFLLLSKITASIWPGVFVATVFAVHPLQVESVAWVSERKTMLSGLFWFLTIAAYAWYTKKPGIWRYIAVFITYGLSLLTKPMVVTLPVVLFLLDYWPLERIGRKKTEDKKQKSKKHNLKVWPLIGEKIPLIALSIVLSVITYTVQQSSGGFMPAERLPPDCRLANMFLSYIKYIGKMLWPNPLVVFYPYPKVNLTSGTVMFCAALLVLLTVIFLYAGRRRKYMLTGWLWFVVTLVPMIGLVQSGGQAMADRYMYIPMLGLLIIIALGAGEFVRDSMVRKTIVSIVAGVILLSIVAVTRAQIGYWQNGTILFEHALQSTKNNYIAEKFLASTFLDEGRLDQAETHFRNSLRICPDYIDGMLALSEVYIKQNKPKEAMIYLDDILRGKGDSAEAYYLIGCALRLERNDSQAIQWYAKALKMNPKHPNVRNEMGAALLALGRTDEAINYFNESVKNLNEVLRTSTNQVDIYINLGEAYNMLGKYDAAILNWSRAAELKPDNPILLNDLAWLLATSGEVSATKVKKAVETARRCCELTGYKNAMTLDTLAAAYAAQGKFEEAITTAEKAGEIAKAAGQKEILEAVEKHIEFFKKGQPYRQK